MFVQDEHEIVHAHWFDEMTVEAGVRRSQSIGWLAIAGRCDQRRVSAMFCPQGLRELIAVWIGQSDIEDTGVWQKATPPRERPVGIVGDLGLEAFVLKRLGEELRSWRASSRE